MSKSTKHKAKQKRGNTKSRRKPLARGSADMTISAATCWNGGTFAQQVTEKLSIEGSARQGQSDQKQQNPETATETENNDKEQYQVSPAAAKDWITVASVLLPTVITVETAVVSILNQTHNYLTILISYVSFVTLIFLTHMLLTHKIWRQEEHRKPLRIFSFVMVLIGTVICLFLTWPNPLRQNDEQNRIANLNKQADAADNVSNPQKVFTIRELNSIMLPVYPQPLLYVYNHSFYLTGGPSERFIAPIGFAVNIEVVNNRPTPTKIHSYAAELETGVNSWTPLNRLPTIEPNDIYFDESGDLKRCVKFDFKHDLFDKVARQKTLLSGDTLDGWMFFEWPVELHSNKTLHNVRIRLQNSQGEIEETVINILSDNNNSERGMSLINTGGFGVKDPRAQKEDLSSLLLRPFDSE